MTAHFGWEKVPDHRFFLRPPAQKCSGAGTFPWAWACMPQTSQSGATATGASASPGVMTLNIRGTFFSAVKRSIPRQDTSNVNGLPVPSCCRSRGSPISLSSHQTSARKNFRFDSSTTYWFKVLSGTGAGSCEGSLGITLDPGRSSGIGCRRTERSPPSRRSSALVSTRLPGPPPRSASLRFRSSEQTLRLLLSAHKHKNTA